MEFRKSEAVHYVIALILIFQHLYLSPGVYHTSLIKFIEE